MLSGSPSRASAGQRAARCFSSRAVLVEAASGGDQLADGRDGAVVFQVRERPRQDLPRFVSVLTKDGKVLGRSLPDGVERLSLAPALGRNHPGAGRTHRDEGELLTARGVVENRERLTPEDVRVSRQLDQRDGALEIGGSGELRQDAAWLREYSAAVDSAGEISARDSFPSSRATRRERARFDLAAVG